MSDDIDIDPDEERRLRAEFASGLPAPGRQWTEEQRRILARDSARRGVHGRPHDLWFRASLALSVGTVLLVLAVAQA